MSTPLLLQVRSLQGHLSNPDRLRLKMKAVTFFESAKHLHSFTSLKHRDAAPPHPSPAPSEEGSGTCMSFSDFLRLAPDDLRSYLHATPHTPLSSPMRLKSIVDPSRGGKL